MSKIDKSCHEDLHGESKRDASRIPILAKVRWKDQTSFGAYGMQLVNSDANAIAS
jgi:hypothetical protein